MTCRRQADTVGENISFLTQLLFLLFESHTRLILHDWTGWKASSGAARLYTRTVITRFHDPGMKTSSGVLMESCLSLLYFSWLLAWNLAWGLLPELSVTTTFPWAAWVEASYAHSVYF